MQLSHDKLQEEQGCLTGLLVLGEVALDALLLLTAERWIGEYHVYPLLLSNFGELEAQRIARVDLWGIEAMQQQIHLAQQIRQRLRLAAEQRLFLQQLAVAHGFD